MITLLYPKLIDNSMLYRGWDPDGYGYGDGNGDGYGNGEGNGDGACNDYD